MYRMWLSPLPPLTEWARMCVRAIKFARKEIEAGRHTACMCRSGKEKVWSGSQEETYIVYFILYSSKLQKKKKNLNFHLHFPSLSIFSLSLPVFPVSLSGCFKEGRLEGVSAYIDLFSHNIWKMKGFDGFETADRIRRYACMVSLRLYAVDALLVSKEE